MAQRTTDDAARAHRAYVSYEEWLARPEDARRSEWVDGEVIEFAVSTTRHQLIKSLLIQVVGAFVESHQLGLAPTSPLEMRLARSARQPDLVFVATANLNRFDDDRLNGPAALAVEIVSADSAERDRVAKLAEYEAAGVREYWIVNARPGRKAVEWFVLGPDSRYAPILPDAAGRLHSTVLPGFWLDPA